MTPEDTLSDVIITSYVITEYNLGFPRDAEFKYHFCLSGLTEHSQTIEQNTTIVNQTNCYNKYHVDNFIVLK